MNVTLSGEPTAPHAEHLAIRQALAELRVAVMSLHPPSPRARIRGLPRSVLADVDLIIETPEDARRLAEELPAHLLMPPIWKCDLDRPNNVAWACGYLHARRVCLRLGQYIPLEARRWTSPYPPGPDHDACLSGAEAYRQGVLHHLQHARLLEDLGVSLQARSPSHPPAQAS